MAEVVISEFMDEAAVRDLAANYDVLYDPTLVERPDELMVTVSTALALIVRNRTQVRGDLLDAAAHLEVIGRLGVGLDNIDTDVCQARGIKVVRAEGANVISVTEYVIAGLLLLLRRAFLATAEVLAGEWPRTRLLGHEVNGKTLGLVGFGAIARETAPRARALGMHVIAYDPFVAADDRVWTRFAVTRCTLIELLRTADAVSLHVPLSEETRHLIDAEAIAQMKAGAVLINSARGGVVDEQALVASLRSGHLAGAMLDVFETEPLPAASHWVGVPNVILTPHIAGVTAESNVRVSAKVAAAVRQALEERG
ncbi:MAG: hydroxyacid dehydrogenase [Acidiferrobacterales bacterium]|nr:hydroxyacid dehydrogenase [Acidiferrobacterales bacterium]